jgi:hypothetical protein
VPDGHVTVPSCSLRGVAWAAAGWLAADCTIELTRGGLTVDVRTAGFDFLVETGWTGLLSFFATFLAAGFFVAFFVAFLVVGFEEAMPAAYAYSMSPFSIT